MPRPHAPFFERCPPRYERTVECSFADDKPTWAHAALRTCEALHNLINHVQSITKSSECLGVTPCGAVYN